MNTYKIILVGDAGVGKTYIISSLIISGKFDKAQITTACHVFAQKF